MAKSQKRQNDEQLIEDFKSSSIFLSHSIITLSVSRDNLRFALKQACDMLDINLGMTHIEERVLKVRESLEELENRRAFRMEQSSKYSDMFIPISEVDLKSRGQSPSRFIDTVVCTIEDPNLILLPRLNAADIAGLAALQPLDPLSLVFSAIRLLNSERKKAYEKQKIIRESVERTLLISLLETASRDCLITENIIRNKVLNLQQVSIQSSGRQNTSYPPEDMTEFEALMDIIESAIEKIYKIYSGKVHPKTGNTV